MVRRANRHGHKVAPQGQRHSVYGRAQTDGGIVIDMSQRRSIHSVGADRVTVDAGATWRDVLAATLPQRLTPPVLANYLDLSVGGTLVIGGVGDTTTRYGMQSDNVLELEVVTGEGRRVRCSPRRNADLFDAVRRRPRPSGSDHDGHTSAGSGTGTRASLRADLSGPADAAQRPAPRDR